MTLEAPVRQAEPHPGAPAAYSQSAPASCSQVLFRFSLIIAACVPGVRDWRWQGSSFNILADWTAAMARKSLSADFEQTMDLLRAHSFDVSPHPEVAGGMLVSKYGV